MLVVVLMVDVNGGGVVVNVDGVGGSWCWWLYWWWLMVDVDGDAVVDKEMTSLLAINL